VSHGNAVAESTTRVSDCPSQTRLDVPRDTIVMLTRDSIFDARFQFGLFIDCTYKLIRTYELLRTMWVAN